MTWAWIIGIVLVFVIASVFFTLVWLAHGGGR